MTLRMLCLLVALVSSAAADDWNAMDDRALEKARGYAETADRELMLSQWKGAAHTLKNLRWQLDRWKQRGLATHAKAQPLFTRHDALAARLDKKQALDPATQPKVWYARRRKGKKKKGGLSPEKPLKWLYRAIERAAPGDEIRVSGPMHGEAGAGHLVLGAPHVKLIGGYTDDFSARDLTRPSAIIRREGVDASSIRSNLLAVEAGAGTVIDGFLFDPRRHNRYDSLGLVHARSPNWAILQVKAHGDVTIRNCVFVNCANDAIDLIANEGCKITVENCVFVNCVTTAIGCRGTGGTFVIRRNTFAMLWAQRSRPGCAVQLRSTGELEFSENLIAHADLAVRSVNGNLNMTLEGNAVHALTRGFLQYSLKGTTSTVGVDGLEDVDVEEDGNTTIDADLTVDPGALLRYLQSTHHPGLPTEGLKAKLIARAAARMPLAEGEEKPVEAPKPKDEPLEDPFGKGGDDEPEDPFGGKKDPEEPKDEPKDAPKDEPKDDTKGAPAQPARVVITRDRYYAPAFAWTGWVGPRAACEAGAKPPAKK